jgi:hypothetical protein
MIPVKGQVNIDHKPVANVIVYFWPDVSTKENFATRHGMGQTDAKGRFVLKCGRASGADGIEAGSYHVTFSRPVAPGGKAVSAYTKPEQRGTVESIPKPYNDHANPKNSPSTAIVSETQKDFVFELRAN